MMNFRKVLTALLVTIGFYSSFAQITADEAVVAMGRGINLGNTLDAPNYEGEWAPAAKEYYFEMYKDAGFQTVRIPITWNKRVATASPYTIDEDFLKRVDTIIGWALDRDMYAIINVHHDGWVKNTTTFDANKDRLYAIWEQLSERYKNHPEELFLEIINEPHSDDGSLTTAQVNELNSECLDIIRADNPTRIVLYGGPNWSSANDLKNAAIPDASDEYLMGYYHSYDPWSFAGQGEGTWGTSNDKQEMINQMAGIQDWSETNSIPVLIGEFGAVHDCDYNSRMRYYAHYTEQALAHGMAFTVWDDGGWFEILERNSSTWDDTKDILIHTTPQSPTNVLAKHVKAEDTTIVVNWTNRARDFDTLYLEKRSGNADFTVLAKFTGDSTSYADTVFNVNKRYYYRLVASYNDSIDLHSYPTSIFISPETSSINNIVDDNSYLYPNPATNMLYINDYTESELASVDIISVSGIKVISTTIEELQNGVRIEELNTGFYLVLITDQNSTITKRFLKN